MSNIDATWSSLKWAYPPPLILGPVCVASRKIQHPTNSTINRFKLLKMQILVQNKAIHNSMLTSQNQFKWVIKKRFYYYFFNWNCEVKIKKSQQMRVWMHRYIPNWLHRRPGHLQVNEMYKKPEYYRLNGDKLIWGWVNSVEASSTSCSHKHTSTCTLESFYKSGGSSDALLALIYTLIR